MNGDDIKEMRKGYGLTQKEFARLFDVSLLAIHHWETGKYLPARFDLVILYRLKELYLYDTRERMSKKLKKISKIKESLPKEAYPYKMGEELENTRLGALLFELFY